MNNHHCPELQLQLTGGKKQLKEVGVTQPYIARGGATVMRCKRHPSRGTARSLACTHLLKIHISVYLKKKNTYQSKTKPKLFNAIFSL